MYHFSIFNHIHIYSTITLFFLIGAMHYKQLTYPFFRSNCIKLIKMNVYLFFSKPRYFFSKTTLKNDICA